MLIYYLINIKCGSSSLIVSEFRCYFFPFLSFFTAPGNVTVSEKNSTSLEISWDPVNATIVGYRIRYYPNATSDIIDNRYGIESSSNCSNLSSIYVCKNKTSICLTDLRVYTDYWIEVIAFTNGTFGNESFNRVFRTGEGGEWYFTLLCCYVLICICQRLFSCLN